jgi:hypothetical protein
MYLEATMSQPVKLSDALVLDARLAGEVQERSIAGQVEFWAKLGRGVELLLDGQRVLSLCRGAGATPLAGLIDIVDTPRGRKMLAKYLESEPYPHYEAHPTQEGLLVRTEENGVRTVGRFVNRVFVAETSRTRAASTGRKPAPSTARDGGQTSRARAVSAKANTSRSAR